jgi:membrane carboxypeptidase/penicillin-binding protein
VGFDQPHTILPNGFAAGIAVPLWAAFMKVATRGDRPEWFTPPSGVTTARVCRLSGKLATDGCDDAEVVDATGHIQHQSLVYTEYFAAGTTPTTYCDLHPTHGFFGKLASVLGVSSGEKPPPAPPKIQEIQGLPPAVSEASPEPQEPAQEQKKKRGFWSRVFGKR